MLCLKDFQSLHLYDQLNFHGLFGGFEIWDHVLLPCDKIPSLYKNRQGARVLAQR